MLLQLNSGVSSPTSKFFCIAKIEGVLQLEHGHDKMNAEIKYGLR